MISLTEIKDNIKGQITLNEPLAGYSTFRIGGVADYFIEPADEKDLLLIVRYAKEKEIPLFILGNGSNILISDDGIRGFVLNLEKGFRYIRSSEDIVTAGAGIKMAKFVDFCIQNNFSGVEMLAGIPATLGGALVMNAGCYGGEIGTYVSEVSVISENEIQILDKEQCGFVYRNSNLKNVLVFEAKFKLPTGNQETLIQKRKEYLLRRNETQPVDIPNAGCIFKNPKPQYAAKIIEECGLKGKAIGGAMVSEKHANFIVNNNNASANDVIELIRYIRKEVCQKTGITLELEIKLIGFEEVLI